MTNEQMYILIGVPGVLALVGILVNATIIGHISTGDEWADVLFREPNGRTGSLYAELREHLYHPIRLADG